MDKYYKLLEEEKSSRSNKHSDLYNEIYGSSRKYDNLDIPENTNEIDISELKKMMDTRDNHQRLKEHQISRKNNEELRINELKEKEEPKIYNINELLEKARTENQKLREVQKKMIHTNYDLLKTLDLEEDVVLEEEKENIRKHYDDLGKTRQMRHIEEDIILDLEKTNSSLPLDILTDLKPTENTIITKAIKEEKKSDRKILEKQEEEKVSEDTEDFYSGAFKFSGKDFDNERETKKRSAFTGFLLIIFIILIITALFLFIVNMLGINIIPNLEDVIKI